MPAELWRPSLDLALHRNRNRPEMRFVQMATVRLDGRPAIRTLVFRGFLDDARRMIFCTDDRSAKRAEINARPYAEICWYFPETREQFRISGMLSLIDDHCSTPSLREARQDVWSSLSEETRLSFTWPAPGEPRTPGKRFPTTPPSATEPVGPFCLMILTADEIDHLELQGAPQHRWQYHADAQGRWSGREVNP